MPRMHYTVEPEGTKVVAQMGHGALDASLSLGSGIVLSGEDHAFHAGDSSLRSE